METVKHACGHRRRIPSSVVGAKALVAFVFNASMTKCPKCRKHDEDEGDNED